MEAIASANQPEEGTMITIFVHGPHYAPLGMVQSDSLEQCARIADERYPGNRGYKLAERDPLVIYGPPKYTSKWKQPTNSGPRRALR